MKRKIALAVLLAWMSSATYAETSQDVLDRLKDRYPATKFDRVQETVIKGIYEVVMGRNVAYTDDSGRYMIFGRLYDMQEQKDLTAQVLDELNKVDISELPLDDAIKTVRGNGQRKIYVFSDPDCTFCKRLEAELAKVDNVTIYTFLYPLEAIHPDAKRKANAIWCAKDRTKAWQSFMTTGKLPKDSKCATPVERNIQLGNRLRINGTPTLIFESGAIAPGAMPANEIERRLSGGQVLGGAAQRAKVSAGG